MTDLAEALTRAESDGIDTGALAEQIGVPRRTISAIVDDGRQPVGWIARSLEQQLADIASGKRKGPRTRRAKRAKPRDMEPVR